MKDYYKILGVVRDADASVIKSAYRRVARELHPDMNGGDPKKTEKFKEACEAYAVLADADKRREYDALMATPGSGAIPKESIFGPEFDSFVRRVSEEGISGANVDSLFSDFFKVAKDVQENLPKRTAERTKTPGGILDLVEEIFGTKVEVGGKKRTT